MLKFFYLLHSLIAISKEVALCCLAARIQCIALWVMCQHFVVKTMKGSLKKLTSDLILCPLWQLKWAHTLLLHCCGLYARVSDLLLTIVFPESRSGYWRSMNQDVFALCWLIIPSPLHHYNFRENSFELALVELSAQWHNVVWESLLKICQR